MKGAKGKGGIASKRAKVSGQEAGQKSGAKKKRSALPVKGKVTKKM